MGAHVARHHQPGVAPCPVIPVLAVPARRPGLSPVHGEFPRYRSVEGAPVVDESSGEGDVFIPRLRPCPVLLIAEAPSQRYAALPIARVQRSDDKFSLDESYEPPALVAATRTGS